jgi:hypothetical protein
MPSIAGNATSYSISPALPAGLSLDTTTGIISGTPSTVTATATYTVTATNSGGNTTFGIVITVNDIAPNSLLYPSPNVFTKNLIIPVLLPTVSGGTTTTFTVVPDLPDGLSLNPQTGAISGIPTTITPTAIYTITATNSGGSTTFDIVITINDIAPSALSYPSPNLFTVGVAVSPIFPSFSGTVTSYSITPDLPAGLIFDTATGTISGTPAIPTPTATYVITAANSGGSTTFDIVITVQPNMGVFFNKGNHFKVYPNPFTDRINVAGIQNKVTYKMYAIEGKLIQQGILMDAQIEFGNIPEGMYLLQLFDGNTIETIKLIKR